MGYLCLDTFGKGISSFWFGVGAYLLFPGVAPGQPAEVDLTMREERLSQKQFPEEQVVIVRDDEFQPKGKLEERWPPAYAPLNRKPSAPLNMEGKRPEIRKVGEIREYPLRNFDEAQPDPHSDLHGRKGRQPGEMESALTRDARVVNLGPSSHAYQALVNNLSMADINPYQFQKNQAREPGLPVTRAGGGPERTRNR